jgi:hypothetical protein
VGRPGSFEVLEYQYALTLAAYVPGPAGKAAKSGKALALGSQVRTQVAWASARAARRSRSGGFPPSDPAGQSF